VSFEKLIIVMIAIYTILLLIRNEDLTIPFIIISFIIVLKIVMWLKKREVTGFSEEHSR